MRQERDIVLARATDIVRETLRDGTANLSSADVSTLVAVTVRDMVQVCHEDQARLTKLEAQTQVLAEAVIAIGQPADHVGPAVAAVKAEMQHADCPECGSSLNAPLHSSPDGHGTKYLRCISCLHVWSPRSEEALEQQRCQLAD